MAVIIITTTIIYFLFLLKNIALDIVQFLFKGKVRVDYRVFVYFLWGLLHGTILMFIFVME